MSIEEILREIKSLEVKKKEMGILAPFFKQHQYVVLSNKMSGLKKAHLEKIK